MRDSFTFYKEFEQALDEIPDYLKNEAYGALLDYFLRGKEYQGDTSEVKIIMALVRGFAQD